MLRKIGNSFRKEDTLRYQCLRHREMTEFDCLFLSFMLMVYCTIMTLVLEHMCFWCKFCSPFMNTVKILNIGTYMSEQTV